MNLRITSAVGVILFFLLSSANFGVYGQLDIRIEGVIDGPLTGGLPKAVEVYVINNIPDLSIYGIGVANNGGGTDGEEFTFPAVSATAGDRFFVASEATSFTSFFGFAPDYTDGDISLNGDDAIELFMNGAVVDVFGDINQDGTGTAWEYLDGWAKRNTGTGPDGTTFIIGNWTFSGPNALDGETSNAMASTPYPLGNFVPPCQGSAGPNQITFGQSPVTLSATAQTVGQWSGGAGVFSNINDPASTYTPDASEINSSVTLTWTSSPDVDECTEADYTTNVIVYNIPDAEFIYDPSTICPNDGEQLPIHTTGTDGIYSYAVVSGGPFLDLNTTTGGILPGSSDLGEYAVTNIVTECGNLMITGAIDGPLTGGIPKAVELYAVSDIGDLSLYGIGSANNGGGTDGIEFVLPAVSLAGGSYYYIASEAIAFESFFGFPPDTVSNALLINGDDAIELFCNGLVMDLFGDINVDGTGQSWEYMDGWAYRMNDQQPNAGTFNDANWLYSGPNALDGTTMNPSFPIGTFSTTFVTPNPDDTVTFNVILEYDEAPQDAMNCNDHLNASLNPVTCSVEVTYNMMIEGIDPALCLNYNVVIEGLADNVITEEGTYYVSVVSGYNENKCWGTITVEDKSPPLIEAPDVTVDCGTDISVEALNNITITDCSYASFETYDEEFGDLCEGNNYIARTIIATDEHGNTAYHVQYIYFNALDLADITPPNQIVTTTCGVISMPDIYSYTGNILDAYPLLNGQPLYPGEHCNILVAKKDKIVEACDLSCSNSVKVVRLWKIYDWCNLDDPVYFEQVISAKDLEAPVIYPYPQIDSFNVDPWTCAVENLVLPIPYITENCTPEAVDITIYGPSGVEVVDGVAKNVPLGEHDFVYYASDCCGNVSDPQIITIAVIDKVIPVAIALQDINLTLTYNVEEDDGVGKLFPESVDNGSYDNCGPVTLRIRREADPCRADSDEYGPFVKFCCRDVGKTFKVWLEVTDTSGNYNETWANVLVEDKFAVIECTDVYIECDDDIDKTISTNRPEAYGTCRSKSVSELYRDYTYYDETCNSGVIYVTWGVRDLEHIRCTQAIYVNYETSLVCNDIHWPDSYKETDCMDLEPVELTWDANACDLIGWTVRSDTFSFESGACAKIVNEYTVIDWCQFDNYYGDNLGSGYVYQGNYFEFEGGNDYFDGVLCADPNPPYYHYDESFSENGVYKYIEIIKLVDDIRPEILLCDYDPFAITNDCSRTVTLSNIGQDNSGCPNTLLTWDLWVTLEDGRLYNYTARSKPGQVVNIDLVDDDGDPLWFYGPMSTHKARWILSDGCGNVDKCETTFMVVDRKDPTPYCVHLSSAVMENGQVEIWARDFDIGSFDNCSTYDSLFFTYDEVRPFEDLMHKVHYFDEGGLVTEEIDARYAAGEIQKWDPYTRSSARVFTCADLPSSTFGMSVWDEKYNTDYCEVKLDLVDNQDACEAALIADIAGTITNKAGDGIEQVDVLIENVNDGTQLSTVTDSKGEYAFRFLPMSVGYEVTPNKKGDITDGLSTEDVLLIQKFIMDESVFDSPYDIIASDLNNDKRISATDIILLQRIIIGQLTELKDGIWKFVDAAQELTFENALADYRSNFAVANLGGGVTSSDFIGVKMGDVTGDAKTSLRGKKDSGRSLAKTKIQVEDVYVSNGQIIEIPMTIPDFQDLVGYQMTITLDDAEVLDVVSGSTSLYASNVGVISDDMVAISYAGIRTSITHEQVFTIKVKVDKSGKLSDVIGVNNNYIASEAYHGIEINPSELELEFVNPSTSSLFSVNQNTPNPFSSETTIQFNTPESGAVTLNVYNVSGQLLLTRTGQYAGGTNEIKINNGDLDFANGVLYYRMVYKDQAITRKMIIIE